MFCGGFAASGFCPTPTFRCGPYIRGRNSVRSACGAGIDVRVTAGTFVLGLFSRVAVSRCGVRELLLSVGEGAQIWVTKVGILRGPVCEYIGKSRLDVHRGRAKVVDFWHFGARFVMILDMAVSRSSANGVPRRLGTRYGSRKCKMPVSEKLAHVVESLRDSKRVRPAGTRWCFVLLRSGQAAWRSIVYVSKGYPLDSTKPKIVGSGLARHVLNVGLNARLECLNDALQFAAFGLR
jgi:hypothetical protein